MPHPSSSDGPQVGSDSVAARELADQLRRQGVVVVAGRALAAARPEGIELVSSLPVLATQVAAEWMAAADCLPLLDTDRLQLRSAAALLTKAASTVEADGIEVDVVSETQIARAIALRAAIHAQAPDAELLDRTWAVLHDLRRMTRPTTDLGEQPDSVSDGLVPSAISADPQLARALPPALNRAACAGTLIGLLVPWLPPAGVDAERTVDSLLQAVASIARVSHDERWREAVATVGRVAASLSVAAAYAAAGLICDPARALAYTLSEPALAVLVTQAVHVANEVSGEVEPSSVAPATAGDGSPSPSPSQQARAAAERAAAERRATQQAFMERAAARAAARKAATEITTPAAAIPTQHAPGQELPGQPVPGQLRDSAIADAAAGAAASQESAATPTVLDLSRVGGHEQLGSPSGDAEELLDSGVARVPSLADVQDELGEHDVVVELAVWDSLMRPR